MENHDMDSALKKKARIAGLIYFILALFSAFGLAYVPSRIIVAGNAVQTTQNIMGSESLFRIGIACNLLGQILFILLVMELYSLFNTVDKFQARLMVAWVIVAVSIMIMLIISQFSILLVLNGAEHLKAFSTEQLQIICFTLMEYYGIGIVVIGIFWGLWLFPLGYLVMKSQFIPRILGILLILSGICYLIDSFTYILIPEFNQVISNVIFVPHALGEFAMILWLLIIGIKREKRLTGIC